MFFFKSANLFKNEKGVAHFFLLFIAVLILAAFLYYSGSVNNLFKTFLSGIFPPSTNAADSYTMNVLVLKYFPVTQDGQNIDIAVTGDVGSPLNTIKTHTNNVTNNLLTVIPKATKYRGYQNANASPSLTYSVVDTKEYQEAVPIDLDDRRRPKYNELLQTNNICNYVDTQNVKEVWLFAYQGPTYPGSSYPYLNISESKMSGPFGDISNSWRENDMPKCLHTYRVYTFNYGRGTAEALHAWSHQIEAEMDAVDYSFFRNTWQGPNYPQTLGVNGRCGSTHNPPNARSEYDYANAISQTSDCLNWNPDGFGTATQVSCTNWGCSNISDSNNAELNYLVWNLQNLPGLNNGKTHLGKPLRNFWEIHSQFDYVMEYDRTFYTTDNSNPPQVSITDSFNRANSTSLGNTETGQPWINLKGSWGINNNTAYSVTGCPAPGFAVVDAGVSDLRMQVKVPFNTQDTILPFRVVDINNMYTLNFMGGYRYQLYKKVGGVQTLLGETATGVGAMGDVIGINVNGPTITVYINGVPQISAADSSINGTKFGIGTWCTTSMRFEDFSLSTLSVPPEPTPTPPTVIPSVNPTPTPTPVPTPPPGVGGFVPGTNYALNKPVTSSTSVEGSGWSKNFVTDGITTSTPESLGWSSSPTLTYYNPENVVIDLQGITPINKVIFYPRTDNPGMHFPKFFYVMVSEDGITYQHSMVYRENFPNPGTNPVTLTFEPLYGRFVKIIGQDQMKGTDNQYRVQFAELEVYLDTSLVGQNETAQNNAALYKNVTASSTFSSYGNPLGYSRFKAVDGVKTTNETTNNGWASNLDYFNNHTEWITVDLGEDHLVSEVVLYPRTQQPIAYFPIDFQIKTSTDNLNFTSVVTQTNYPAPTTNSGKSFTFSETQARYIQIHTTKLGWVNPIYRVQLAEIEILGTPLNQPQQMAAFSQGSRMLSNTPDSTAIIQTNQISPENFRLPAGAEVLNDPTAQGGKSIVLKQNGTFKAQVTSTGTKRVGYLIAGDYCNGGAKYTMRVNNVAVARNQSTSKRWINRKHVHKLPPGTHTIEVTFTNDYFTQNCDRNLKIDQIYLQN